MLRQIALSPHNAPVDETHKLKPARQNNDCAPSKPETGQNRHLPDSMNDKAGEKDDEQVMRVPEDLEVAASDDLHGGGDDED